MKEKIKDYLGDMEEKKPKDYLKGVKVVFLIALAAMSLNILFGKRNVVCINYPELPKRAISMDINRDGLEDFIRQDGKVLVKQINGTYKSLAEIRQNELDSVCAKVNTKYTFNPERVRNSVDNLGYTVKTGRYVLGN